MVSESRVLAFALASLVLVVVPGPGVLFVVSRALAHGRRTALATVVGHGAGNYLVAMCVAFGLGGLIERSAAVFLTLKVAGSLYLVWLGILAIRRRGALEAAFGAATTARSARQAIREGFVVGVTNPKAFILFGAVLPQFVDRASGHASAQMLLLSGVSVGIGLVSDSGYGVTAGAVRTWFARSPRRFELVGGAAGLAMIGVGVSVAVAGRTE